MVIKVSCGARVIAIAIMTTLVRLSFGHAITLRDCLLLPNGHKNIISISLLLKEIYEFYFKNNVYYIYYCNQLVGTSLMNDSYYLNIDDSTMTKYHF